jgi:hypothetical protein
MRSVHLPRTVVKKGGRSQTARRSILRQIEDVKDSELARRRFARGGPRVTLEALERQAKTRARQQRPR